MKTKTNLIVIAAIALMSGVSSGTVALSGAALKNVQGTPGTDLPNGNLGLLIVDTQGNGFLKGRLSVSGSYFLSELLDPGIASAEAGLTLGSTFGGDLVVARLETRNAFGDTTMSPFAIIDAADYLGMDFAIVWFNTLTRDAATVEGGKNMELPGEVTGGSQ